MKKKKITIYFVIPLIGVAVFGGFFWRFNAQDEAKQVAAAAEAKQAREAEQERKNAELKRAYDEQLSSVNARIAEKERRDAEEARKREERAQLTARKVETEQEAVLLANDVTGLNQDVEDARTALDDVKSENATLMNDVKHYQDYAKTVQAEMLKTQQTLQAVQKAEAARQEYLQKMQQMQAEQQKGRR